MSSYGTPNRGVCDDLPFFQTVGSCRNTIIHTVCLAHLTRAAPKEEKSLSWMKLCIHKQAISLHLVLCWGKNMSNCLHRLTDNKISSSISLLF